MISETYADLGGGIGTAMRRAERPRMRPAARPAGAVCVQHMFDPVSGWCGCGIRDDGKLAEGSPAWRAELDRRMPSAEAL